MKQPMTIDQLLERVQTVWDEARGDRDMPRRGDIDPVKLGGALQYMSSLDVVPGDPIDFHYRVMGEHLIQRYGSNLTGQLHTKVADQTATAWPFYEAYVTCMTTKQPHRFNIRHRNRNKVLTDAKGSVWPLSDDGIAVSGILGACMFFVPHEFAA